MSRSLVGAGLLGLMVSLSCVPRTAHRQTEAMERSGTVQVSAAELRAAVNDLADRFVSRIEYTADQILAATADRDLRRRALLLKIDAIPTVYTAAYRTDPLGAMVDMWALAFQVVHYVEEGGAADAYGEQQAMVQEAARGLLTDVDAVVLRVMKRPQDFGRYRERVDAWSRQHPIEHTPTSRPSMAAFAAELETTGRDAFVAISEASDTLENLSQRLNTYAAHLPRQARWEAELMMLETTGERGVEGALVDIHDMGTTARHTSDLLEDVSREATGSQVREAVASERRAVLEGLNQQRLQTLEYMTAERLAVLAAVREERIATLDALHQERIQIMEEVDAIKTRAVESAVSGLREVVDYILWRTALLFLVLMIFAAALGVVAYRLTLGRR